MNWDLTYHFKTVEDFNQAFNEVAGLISKLGEFKGTLGTLEGFKGYYTYQKKNIHFNSSLNFPLLYFCH